MTGSSSKLLQIQGKWYWERKQKTNPKPEAKKTTKTILHPNTMVIVTYCDPPKPSNHKATITRNLHISRQVGTLSFSGLARHVRGLGASGGRQG